VADADSTDATASSSSADGVNTSTPTTADTDATDANDATTAATPSVVSSESADESEDDVDPEVEALSPALAPALDRLLSRVAELDDDDTSELRRFTMEVPGREGRFSMRTILRQLWEGLKGQAASERQKSLPRLLRIMQTARMVSINVTQAASSAGDLLTIGCNVAVVYMVPPPTRSRTRGKGKAKSTRAKVSKVYYGQVIKIIRKSGTKSTSLLRPVALDDVDDASSISVVCEWFVSDPTTPRAYKLGTLEGAEEDRQPAPLSSVLGLAFFDWNEETRRFVLLNGQAAKFNEMAEKIVDKTNSAANKSTTPSAQCVASATSAPSLRPYTTGSDRRAAQRVADATTPTNT
jgi:hypothetical protein